MTLTKWVSRMPDIFGVDIAAAVGDALGDQLPEVRLTRRTESTRTDGQLTGGKTVKEKNHNTVGIVEEYSEGQIDGEIVKMGDRKLLIIAANLPTGVVPQPGDRARTENVIYDVVAVKRDPAAATYTLQVRRA